MDEDEAYLWRVDTWTQDGIQRGLHSLNDLAGGLPGVYPTCIRDSINRLSRAGVIPSEIALELSEPVSSGHIRTLICETDNLPLPHPLDFEWRFSWSASVDRHGNYPV